ncbi:MAG TPA: hypothetical protein VLB80_02705 [Candidatus Babeliales bacterium]|nr:hypothetical protein [Candidatus Babeliales bacterium]
MKRSYVAQKQINEIALVFKKQDISISKELFNQDLPLDIIINHIIPILKDSFHQVSLKDIILAMSWSNGWYAWLESSPPQTTIQLNHPFASVSIHEDMSNVLYAVECNWNQLYTQNWIRCKSGIKKQPVYTDHNFKYSEATYGFYRRKYSPYFREILSEGEMQEGSLWKPSHCIRSDEQKTGQKERVVWFKFPFEVDYFPNKKGQYNSQKKSPWQFIDGTSMDSTTNPYLDQQGKKLKSFMPGKTARDATWSLESDVHELYKDDAEWLTTSR